MNLLKRPGKATRARDWRGFDYFAAFWRFLAGLGRGLDGDWGIEEVLTPTELMIVAGARAYHDADHRYETAESIVARIFMAMAEVHREEKNPGLSRAPECAHRSP